MAEGANKKRFLGWSQVAFGRSWEDEVDTWWQFFMEQREGKKHKVPLSAKVVAMDTVGILDWQHARGTSTRVWCQECGRKVPTL